MGRGSATGRRGGLPRRPPPAGRGGCAGPGGEDRVDCAEGHGWADGHRERRGAWCVERHRCKRRVGGHAVGQQAEHRRNQRRHVTAHDEGDRPEPAGLRAADVRSLLGNGSVDSREPGRETRREPRQRPSVREAVTAEDHPAGEPLRNGRQGRLRGDDDDDHRRDRGDSLQRVVQQRSPVEVRGHLVRAEPGRRATGQHDRDHAGPRFRGGGRASRGGRSGACGA